MPGSSVSLQKVALEDILFLLDEAHNLVERGRQMYSAELCKEDFLAVKKLVKGEAPWFAKRLEACNKILLAMKKECENYKVLDNISHLGIQLMNVLSEADRYLEECVDKEVRENVLDFYFQVRSFLNIYDGLDENYVVYTEYREDGRFVLKLFCVNPAAICRNVWIRGTVQYSFRQHFCQSGIIKDF